MEELKPIIFIPSATHKTKPDSSVPMLFTRKTYIKKIIELGGIPIIVPSLISNNDNLILDYTLQNADAILFAGGSDFDPRYYNQEKHEKTEIADTERDEFEINLMKKAFENRVPVLGICRGAQCMAIASGGSLIQHIPDISTQKHDVEEYDNLFDNTTHHLVKINIGTRVYDILKCDSIVLNTAHHQAVDKVGKDFRIAGLAEDGTVEIIEHIDQNYFCFGFQSHIEAMSGPTDIIFEEFIESAKKYKVTK